MANTAITHSGFNSSNAQAQPSRKQSAPSKPTTQTKLVAMAVLGAGVSTWIATASVITFSVIQHVSVAAIFIGIAKAVGLATLGALGGIACVYALPALALLTLTVFCLYKLIAALICPGRAKPSADSSAPSVADAARPNPPKAQLTPQEQALFGHRLDKARGIVQQELNNRGLQVLVDGNFVTSVGELESRLPNETPLELFRILHCFNGGEAAAVGSLRSENDRIYFTTSLQPTICQIDTRQKTVTLLVELRGSNPFGREDTWLEPSSYLHTIVFHYGGDALTYEMTRQVLTASKNRWGPTPSTHADPTRVKQPTRAERQQQTGAFLRAVRKSPSDLQSKPKFRVGQIISRTLEPSDDLRTFEDAWRVSHPATRQVE